MKNNYDDLFDSITRINKFTPELIKLGGFFTAFGAFLLILYFQKIRYLPPMKLDDFTFLFIASAMFGFQLVVLLAALTLSTGLLWQRAIVIPEIKKQFIDAGKEGDLDKAWVARFYILFLWFIFPASVLAGSALLLMFEFQIIPIVLIIITIAIILFNLKCKLGVNKEKMFSFICLLAFSVVTVTAALIPWMQYANNYLTSVDGIKDTFLAISVISFLVMALLIGSAIAINPHDGFMQNIESIRLRTIAWFSMVGICITIFLLLFFGGTNLISIIAKNYGFGGISNAEVIFNSEGKETIESLGFQCKLETKLCVLEGVNILWARGDEYVFQLNNPTDTIDKTDKKNEDKSLSKSWFTIPRKLVLSIKLPLPDNHGI